MFFILFCISDIGNEVKQRSCRYSNKCRSSESCNKKNSLKMLDSILKYNEMFLSVCVLQQDETSKIEKRCLTLDFATVESINCNRTPSSGYNALQVKTCTIYY